MAKTRSLTFYPYNQVYSFRPTQLWEIRTIYRDFDEKVEFVVTVSAPYPIINQSPVVMKMLVPDEGESLGSPPTFIVTP